MLKPRSDFNRQINFNVPGKVSLLRELFLHYAWLMSKEDSVLLNARKRITRMYVDNIDAIAEGIYGRKQEKI